MSKTYRYMVSYRFNDQLRDYPLELEQSALPAHVAAWHLLQLHFGDAENSLIMPSSDATPAAILDQALLLGIASVSSRLID
jgi:hypothetical protein